MPCNAEGVCLRRGLEVAPPGQREEGKEKKEKVESEGEGKQMRPSLSALLHCSFSLFEL